MPAMGAVLREPTTLAAGDTMNLPEIGAATPFSVLYADVDPEIPPEA